jgi:hypothetical protein
VFLLGVKEGGEVDDLCSRLWGHNALPIGDLTGIATFVSILSILLNVCHTGDHPLWAVARAGVGRMATVAMPSFSCWRLGPGGVTAPSCMSYKARATNLEVL